MSLVAPTAQPHQPVMLREVIDALAPKTDGVYVDATFGAGGYSRAILEAAECRVYAIDRDPQVVMLADALARDFPGHFLLLAGCFGDMVSLLAEQGISQVDGIVMDLGVSSMQIDNAERGFSFRQDGPLDMRMGTRGLSADILVNSLPEKELADIIFNYGEERASRAIARAILRERELRPIETTGHLADIVRKAIRGHSQIDPATRTFQALRIHVNAELEELEKALAAAPGLLKPGGVLVVVTFHSLEDRIVKRFMRPKEFAASRHDMAALVQQQQQQQEAMRFPFELPIAKPILPGADEVRYNPRSRSAKMRVAVRNNAALPERVCGELVE